MRGCGNSVRPRLLCSGGRVPGWRGAAFLLQLGELGLQVADPLAETAQLSGQALVRAADVAEKSLSHDGRSSFPSWHHARLKARCTADGDRMEKASAAG
jgi:hypothetical protein